MKAYWFLSRCGGYGPLEPFGIHSAVEGEWIPPQVSKVGNNITEHPNYLVPFGYGGTLFGLAADLLFGMRPCTTQIIAVSARMYGAYVDPQYKELFKHNVQWVFPFAITEC